MSYQSFAIKKNRQEKIVMLTCYDYSAAKILNQTRIDALLVGDSAAMTMHGFNDTLMATLTMMELHTAAVRRGAPEKYIVSDLPFLSYRQSKKQSMLAVQRLIRAGAQAIKLEGADGNLSLIRHLVESGIPVMGHLGLTPQLVLGLGGYKVQGQILTAAEKLKHDAQALQAAGCFALVLECVPSTLTAEITQSLEIATIGIGAGQATDGQILVWHDLLGLNLDFKPKFVKQFLSGAQLITESIEQYIQSTQQQEFPTDEHSYAS